MQATVLQPDEGDALWMFDSLDTIKADAEQTGGAFSVVEFLEFEGSGPPTHVHRRYAQGFYVLEGEVEFAVAEQRSIAGPGTWLFVQPGVARAWMCRSWRARVLSITAPGGFEAFYRAVGERVDDRTQLPARAEPDVEEVARAAARYDVAIVGPPLNAGW